MGLGPWSVGFDINQKILFIFYFYFFETMHLPERLQTFRKVAFGFLNSTQTFVFGTSWHFQQTRAFIFEREKTVKEFCWS